MNKEDIKRIEWGLKNKDKFLSDEHFHNYMIKAPVKSFDDQLDELYKKGV